MAPASAIAELYAADGVFYVTTDATVVYDSNIFTNSSEVQSVIYLVSPGLHYIRDEGYIRMEAEAGVEFSHFTDRSQYNSQNPFASVLLNMPFRDGDYPLALKGSADYARTVSADPTVGRRLERTTYVFQGRADYRVHREFVTWLSGGYEYYDYQTDLNDPEFNADGTTEFPGSNVVDLELGGAYQYSTNLDLGLSGRARWTDHDVWESTDYAFFAVAEGQLLSRTTGTVRVGAQFRTFDADLVDDEWTPYVRIELNWDTGETMSWLLAVTSDYQPTSANDSVASRAVSLTLRKRIITKIEAYLTGVVERLELDNPTAENREDDVLRAVLGAKYTLTELMALNGSISIESRDSSANVATYERLVAQIGLQGRF